MLIGSLSEKAEEADSKAKTALGNSAIAASSAHEAGIAAGQAQQEADGVARQAEELMQKLRQAEMNLALTQSLVSARSVDNHNALIGQLKQFKGQAVTVGSYAADGEGYYLCESIYFAVHSAEMNPTDECGKVYPTVPLATHIAIAGPDVQETLSLGGMISRTGRLGVSSGIKAPTLSIFVGIKAPFVIGPAQPVRKKAPTEKQTSKQSAKP
jgi:hypothetical protein